MAERGLALKPLLFLGTLGTQLTLLIPVLFCGMVVVYFKLTKKVIKKRRLFDDPTNFLLAFSVPIIGFFFAVSLITRVKLNWMMPGYVAAIILTSRYLGKKMVFSQVVLSLIIHILLFIQVAFYVVEVKSDDTWFGWEQLAEEVETLKEQNPDSFIFSKDGYKVSAVLNFYMDEHVYSGNVVGENGLQFSIIDSELDHLEGIHQCVDCFLTIGSPLGMNYVQRRLINHDNQHPDPYPGNIRKWINVSARGDLVALDPAIANDFDDMVKKHYIESIEDRAKGVYNFYRDEKGLNVHKSYGYLANPVVARIIIDWWKSA